MASGSSSSECVRRFVLRLRHEVDVIEDGVADERAHAGRPLRLDELLDQLHDPQVDADADSSRACRVRVGELRSVEAARAKQLRKGPRASAVTLGDVDAPDRDLEEGHVEDAIDEDLAGEELGDHFAKVPVGARTSGIERARRTSFQRTWGANSSVSACGPRPVPNVKRRSGRGCGSFLLVLVFLVAVSVGLDIVGERIDRWRFPWGYADMGHPSLAGTGSAR